MKKITFEKPERVEMVGKIQRFFVSELDGEIGNLSAERLLQFVSETIGPFYYNQGLHDAQAVFRRQLDNVDDEI